MLDLPTIDIIRFEASASEAAKLLRALGNERRLMILCQLADGERSVGELRPLVGLSQSALSQHLAVLREEGVVATRREAQTIWYRIENPAALKVVATLAEIFCPAEAKKTPMPSTAET
ncbi:metalloregulator ArsR/SmtB family transcription factor [Phenylobacterium sp. LH3H17]|uniref:ArsR/SmtB family transcription factor n=1 Tax=Phenylobacterium sp. LH3H17 TaxID=2903901 RepID=UPI0020C9D105|nr:metalloregulator ArsR/SmtB family transcription factor [Phenylobacterium sp. LH3H17]UTP39555.1 metalloregulator ArsR/SmtB family transcription factor [Phenylobacterium sp. LH3H17]